MIICSYPFQDAFLEKFQFFIEALEREIEGAAKVILDSGKDLKTARFAS